MKFMPIQEIRIIKKVKIEKEVIYFWFEEGKIKNLFKDKEYDWCCKYKLMSETLKQEPDYEKTIKKNGYNGIKICIFCFDGNKPDEKDWFMLC